MNDRPGRVSEASPAAATALPSGRDGAVGEASSAAQPSSAAPSPSTAQGSFAAEGASPFPPAPAPPSPSPPPPRLALRLTARDLCREGKFREALVLLDRFHRTGPDTPGSRLLEASARRGLAGPVAAIAPLQRAYALDPTDPTIQTAILGTLGHLGSSAEGADGGLAACARWIAAEGQTPPLVCRALDFSEPDRVVTGHVERRGERIGGWLAWKGGEPLRRLRLELRRGTCDQDGEMAATAAVVTLEAVAPPDTAGRYGAWSIATFQAPWPDQAAILDVRDEATGAALRGSPLLHERWAFAGEDTGGPASAAIASFVAEVLDVVIIIPVYRGRAALEACLDALERDGTRLRRTIILVDDASPEAEVAAVLDTLQAEGRHRVLRNPVNLGFARAVNRALPLVPPGTDIVLLNSDTLVPPGWLDRLHVMAREPGIGTITPLSNNGELTSIPLPFAASPLGSYADTVGMDAAAQALGGGLVNLPNGIGFCLYVTAQAAAAAGAMDEAYGKGYLEDVDYCLKVRQAGFRNVCATSLYVGHAGGTSFGAARSALVMHNSRILRARWPDIDTDTDAFMAADPLSALRGPMLFAWLRRPDARPRVLFLSSSLEPDALLWDDARRLWPDHELLALMSHGTGTCRLSVGTLPQSNGNPLRLSIPQPLAVAVDLLKPDRIVLLDLAIGRQALAALDASGATLEAFVASDRFFEAQPVAQHGSALLLELWRRIRRAYAPCRAAAKAIRSFAAPCPDIVPLPLALAPPREAGVAAPAEPAPPRIGLLSTMSPEETTEAARSFAAQLRLQDPSLSVVVFGRTSQDEALIAQGIFVTGDVPPDDTQAVLALHPCCRLVLLQGQACFHHPAFGFIRRAGLPFLVAPKGAGLDLLEDLAGGSSLADANAALAGTGAQAKVGRPSA